MGLACRLRFQFVSMVRFVVHVSFRPNTIAPPLVGPHPRLYHKDVLPGILWVATLMLVFVHSGTLMLRSCISLSFPIRLYGSVLIEI